MLEAKKTNGWFIGLVLVVYAALSIWINLYGFRAGLLDVELFNGLINSTLVANFLLLVVVVIGLLFGLGRLRPSDVGLYRRQIVPALLTGVVIWVIFQLVALIAAFFSGSVSINSLWRDEGGAAVAGRLIGQLLGNALVEEIVFRGFLFSQLLLRFDRLPRRWISLTLTLVISQSVFALLHIPNRVWVDDMTFPDALLSTAPVFVIGVLLALMYWRTRNLLLIVAIHALINEPTSIMATSDAVHSLTVLLLTVSLILFWSRSWMQSQPVNA